VRKGDYDLIIFVVLQNAKISANEQKEENFTQTKKVVTSYYYKVDSTGKKQKVPVYSEVTCNVKKVIQRKIAHIYGELEYVDNHSKQTVKVVPVAADHVFENAFAIYTGDKRACSDNVLKLSRNSFVAFPSDIDMIIGAEKTLRNVIWKALLDNRRFVMNRF
jgi:hypothetical protein